MVRVRFAPSPTGFLHIGNLRAALYNQLFALHNKGVFLLRVEDTDQTRFVEGAMESMLRTLKATGIEPDEGVYLTDEGEVGERGAHGPYIQSMRRDIHAAHAQKLIESGDAYRCFCTAERLDEVRAAQTERKARIMYDRKCRRLSPQDIEAALAAGTPFTVRLAVPERGETTVTDLIRGTVQFSNEVIDDQVLMKSDGYPTYHLANVVDDHLMEVTHVIRGEEWLPSVPKHVLLYRAFGWEPPQFAHLPLLLNPDRSKLSKRQGDVAAEDYLAQGYLPEALVNFIALLGWNPTGDREIYAKQELAELFDITKVNAAGAVFSREKLDWMNQQYLRALTDEQLFLRALPFLTAAGALRQDGDAFRGADGGEVSRERALRAVAVERSRITTLGELPEAVGYLLRDGLEVDAAQLPGKKATPEIAKQRLGGMIMFLESLPASAFDDAKALETQAIAHIKEQGWTNAETLWPTRFALAGRAASPGPFELLWVLGRERGFARMRAAMELLP